MFMTLIIFIATILKVIIKFFFHKSQLTNNITKMSATSLSKLDSTYCFRPYEIKRVKYKIQVKNRKSIPCARSGHRIVCSDSAIYCFGGFNPNLAVVNEIDDEASCLFQELWRYDIIRNEWSLLLGPDNDMPHELASNAMILQGDMLVVFGGTGFPFGVNCSNKLLFCQPEITPKGMAELDVTGDLPPPQYGQAILYHENCLYTIGGTQGFDYTCDVHKLNALTKTWELVYACRQDIRDDPPGRYRHEVVFDGDRIFVIGGGTSESTFSLASIPTYHIKSNKWTYTATKPDPQLPPPGVPAPRKCHSCVQYQTDYGIEAIVAGGYDGRSYYGDVWKLNLVSFEWRLMQKSVLPYPLFFHDAAATSEGCMYIFGGIKFSANNNVRTNVIYKVWTTIPKLSEICWEALLHYNSDLVSKAKNDQLEMGIPLKFVKRCHKT